MTRTLTIKKSDYEGWDWDIRIVTLNPPHHPGVLLFSITEEERVKIGEAK